jgi:hypothetical protein
MLHIVQVVTRGVAETPQLFLDDAKARTAFVEGVRKHWEERYSDYCGHHGLSGDSFASAQAFVSTIDVSEKSRIHYWTFKAEEIGLGNRKICGDASPVEAQTGDGPKVVPPPPAVRQEKPEPDPAACATPEWKAFVGTIKRLGSGSRNEFYLLHRDDWRQDVYSDRTSLEYWDWVADRIMKYKERAKCANYSVIEDPAASGCYKFINQEGIASEDCCDSEWEAWCAAGLDLEADCRGTAG